MIAILVVTYLKGALIASEIISSSLRELKYKHESHDNEHEICPKFDNCFNYQVTKNLTEYGCSTPNKKYLL